MGRLRVGELVSRSFGLVFGRFRAYLTTVGVVVGALSLVSLAFTLLPQPDFRSPTIDGATLTLFVGGGLVFTVLTILGSVASIGIATNVTDALLRGQPMTLAEAWDRTRPRYGAIFVALLAFAGVAAAVAIVFGIAFGVGAISLIGGGAGAAFVLLAILIGCAGTVVMFWMFTRWGVALPHVTLTMDPASASLRRSVELTVGARGALFGAFFLAGLAVYVPIGIVNAITTLNGGASPSVTMRIVSWVFSTAASFVSVPLFSAMAVLAYRALGAPPADEPAPMLAPGPLA